MLALAAFPFIPNSLPDHYAIPGRNSEVSFAPGSLVGASIDHATLSEDTWNFYLKFNDTSPNGQAGTDFLVSAENCNLTITNYDVPKSQKWQGWLNYTVSGEGTQFFQTYAFSYSNEVHVYIDGEYRELDDGWTLPNETGGINVTDATVNASIHFAGGAPIFFTSQTLFEIPEYNGSISFAMGGSYPHGVSTAYNYEQSYTHLKNDTWYFKDLALNSYTLNLTAFGRSDAKGIANGSDVVGWLPNSGDFSVSAQNCKVEITSLDPLVWMGWNGPHSGWLNYTVNGVGTQRFNLYYSSTKLIPLNYTVYIDGIAHERNSGWSHLDGWLTVTGAVSNVSIHYDEEVAVIFASGSQFRIEDYNSTVIFAKGGGYDAAVLENNTWSFTGLTWNTTEPDLDALSISAKDCNVTITDYTSDMYFSGRLNYDVSGVGTQTFNLNNDNFKGEDVSLSVTIDGNSRALNDGWSVSDDGFWLTVIGATSSVRISFYRIMPPP